MNKSLKPKKYHCAICNEEKPEHNRVLRKWDKVEGIYDASKRVGIASKVAICRMCNLKMRRARYQTLGVMHYKHHLETPTPPPSSHSALRKGRKSSRVVRAKVSQARPQKAPKAS
jgi:hypothetical protein